MTTYLTKEQILSIHGWSITAFGGTVGVLHEAIVDSAVAAPQMTFGQTELYQSLAAKASALAYPLIHDHPFRDGNKRTGFVAADVFISLNGHQLVSSVEDAEEIVVKVAAGDATREDLQRWIETRLVPNP